MLQISRKVFNVPFNQVYFQEAKYESRYEPEIVYYTHVLKPSRKLQGQITLHIDLRNEPVLDNLMNVLEGKQIENWMISRFDSPTDQEIEEFQGFYNKSAKGKNTRTITQFDVQTLKLLRDQGGLVMTKIENEQMESICYRVYVVGKEIVMAIFNDGQGLQNDQIKQSANYLLCWENMKHFGNKGIKIYDFGDIKDLTFLEKLKHNFGGQMVTVFSGYKSNSLFSQMLLQFNFKRFKKRLSF
ncbi:hypothetical protein QMK38_16875 [Lysinibacillus fusiformis]|nr:hypothetical protein [Lysinibacillus fusiformis]